ncbi:MAG TPA: hypothetical protein VJO53_10805 [Candidatus Acidoferrales bacterium]|nr:hypothetical protein [Candidatus Acidoferrales bacterium]
MLDRSPTPDGRADAASTCRRHGRFREEDRLPKLVVAIRSGANWSESGVHQSNELNKSWRHAREEKNDDAEDEEASPPC